MATHLCSHKWVHPFVHLFQPFFPRHLVNHQIPPSILHGSDMGCKGYYWEKKWHCKWQCTIAPTLSLFGQMELFMSIFWEWFVPKWHDHWNFAICNATFCNNSLFIPNQGHVRWREDLVVAMVMWQKWPKPFVVQFLGKNGWTNGCTHLCGQMGDHWVRVFRILAKN